MGSAHDCSEGGLAVAVAECCIAGAVGASLDLPVVEWEVGASAPEASRPDSILFGETQSSIIVTCSPGRLPQVAAAAREHGVPYRVLGSVGGGSLVVRQSERILINLSVEEMERLWKESISSMMS